MTKSSIPPSAPPEEKGRWERTGEGSGGGQREAGRCLSLKQSFTFHAKIQNEKTPLRIINETALSPY